MLHELSNSRYIHIPIQDFRAPTPEQIETAMINIEKALKTEGNVLIHCLTGKGRTGTILACWFIKEKGLSASEAIKKIRDLRPGSIETVQQSQAVEEYEKLITQPAKNDTLNLKQ